jgi:hypothetical protein
MQVGNAATHEPQTRQSHQIIHVSLTMIDIVLDATAHQVHRFRSVCVGGLRCLQFLDLHPRVFNSLQIAAK